MHDYCNSYIYYFTFFLSLLTSLSHFQLLLSPLSLLSPVPQSSLTNTISTARRRDDISAWAMTSWPGEANHGGFSGTGLGLSDDISALENRNHNEANYYLDLLWGLELQRLLQCHDPQWVLADHAYATEVWHFFWSRFSMGFRDSEKKEGSRWWESRSSKKWVRKRGWWWLMMDFLFWIFFFFFFVWSVLDFLFDQ